MTTPAKDTKLLQTAQRRSDVIRLREAGATWEDVARAIERQYGADRLPAGWDRRYAYKDFMRELEKLREDIKEGVEEIREMETRRLERMQRSIWQKSINADGATTWKQQREAIDRMLRIMQRRAQLLGLDMPQRVEGEFTLGGPVTIQPVNTPPSPDDHV